MKNLTGSLEFINKSLEIKPNNIFALSQRAILNTTGNPREALMYIERGLEIEPEDPYFTEQREIIRSSLGNVTAS